MKKLICTSLILLALLGCLTACNFTQSITGALADQAESTPMIEEMMTDLAESNTSDAKALMHPQVAEKSDAAIDQMCTFLSGRDADDMELMNINITSSAGTSGKARQEQVTYKITLTDSEVIYINAVYLSNNAGTGFISFQLIMGFV